MKEGNKAPEPWGKESHTIVSSAESKIPPVEMGNLMRNLEQRHKRLKCGEEDLEELKREVRYNKNENLDNYFNIARATGKKLQQKAERVETTKKNGRSSSKSIWKII